MYPSGELSDLAVYKAILRRRISRRRADSVAAAAGAVRPLAWLDRAIDFWRHISPLAKIAALPVALLVKRALFPREGLFGKWVRWAPVLFTAGRAFAAMRRPARP